MRGYFTPSKLSWVTKLSTKYLKFCWTVTAFSWFVYWVILLYLNCPLGEWIHAELSKDCLECYCYSNWFVCRVILLLTVDYCVYGYILTELCNGCLERCWTITRFSWSVCRVIFLYLNCLLSGYILTVLSTPCPEYCWTITCSIWFVSWVTSLYLNF